MNLREIIENSEINGTTFISIDTETVVPLTGGKKNPMQGRVTKRVTGSNVMVFTNKNSNGYENMVNRRLVQEGKDPESFELQPRKWGTRIPNSPIIEHKDALYLEVIFLKAGVVQYYLDGSEIRISDIEGLASKQESEQGGLDNKVIIRTFAFESIKKIRINKMEYVLD